LNERDYYVMVKAALTATLIVLAVKLSTVFAVANIENATLQLRSYLGFFPNIVVVAERPTFVKVVTYSTTAMAVASALRFVLPGLRGGFDCDVVQGRLVGLVISVETAVFEITRHFLAGPVVTWGGVIVTAAAVTIGALLASIALRRSPRLILARMARRHAENETSHWDNLSPPHVPQSDSDFHRALEHLLGEPPPVLLDDEEEELENVTSPSGDSEMSTGWASHPDPWGR
jgi:hypothetical protein